MARTAPVAGEVDGSVLQAFVLERLEDRDGLRREVLVGHGEDRVADRPARPARADGGEGGAVLDDPLLLAVVPDEVGNPWTSGWAPVAIEVRQTGVTDGKVVVPRV